MQREVQTIMKAKVKIANLKESFKAETNNLKEDAYNQIH